MPSAQLHCQASSGGRHATRTCCPPGCTTAGAPHELIFTDVHTHDFHLLVAQLNLHDGRDHLPLHHSSEEAVKSRKNDRRGTLHKHHPCAGFVRVEGQEAMACSNVLRLGDLPIPKCKACRSQHPPRSAPCRPRHSRPAGILARCKRRRPIGRGQVVVPSKCVVLILRQCPPQHELLTRVQAQVSCQGWLTTHQVFNGNIATCLHVVTQELGLPDLCSLKELWQLKRTNKRSYCTLHHTDLAIHRAETGLSKELHGDAMLCYSKARAQYQSPSQMVPREPQEECRGCESQACHQEQA
eukprot:188941-Amphidinium_carterae.1